MISSVLRSYFSEIGRKGGRKSRRALSRDAARQMVAVRMARRAYRDFRVQCFWSFRDVPISVSRVGWVVEQLQRNGNRAAWDRAAQIRRLLCP